MKWIASDIETYAKEKEYVDTIVVPLIPFGLENNLKGTVSAGEYISIISHELERQLRGRLLLLPPFTYLNSEPMEEKVKRLAEWHNEVIGNGASYVVYLTSDVEWKNAEDRLEDTLVWLPSIPLEHMDNEYKMETVSTQVKQVLQIVTKKWQNSPK
ncbi:DUF2487 family protein [Pseudalkalibacillus caeni]|uniref:DUF2487 family protein n=1 Tax=Exobacillus caeni TaxID=2574798 RepID=A0A5R9F2X3_9BACL|nr:DUF2487 family protein [Pseudalkalibacillus caeni]TLS35898.1 DUF2487 family protein [Pseudalkalibacillus caeni]